MTEREDMTRSKTDKYLVTGGAGYIGGFMTRRLLDEGHRVVVADNLKRGHRQAVDPRATLYVGDLRNTDTVAKLFDQEGQFDGVIHFAAFISMGESMQNPGLYFSNNIQSSLNIIDEMVKRGQNNFIFSSTAGVYGNPTKIPIPEDHPTTPENPYGQSKLMVEQMLSWYLKTQKLSYVSLRYFNAAGGALDGSMGEQHSPESHIIPNIIHAALEQRPFKLFGTDYKTHDGTCVRDYIHVLDLVTAHLLALDKLNTTHGGFVYNVGTGHGYSNKEVVEKVREVTAIDLTVEHTDRRPGDADILVADATKIQTELGFKPRYSDLETIIKTAWEWHKKEKISR